MCQPSGNPEEKLTHDGWESIKERKRRCCTDCLCLVSNRFQHFFMITGFVDLDCPGLAGHDSVGICRLRNH